jgi:hypothetical protein
MHRYVVAGSLAHTLLAIAALVLCTALSAGAQTPGAAQYTTIFSFDNYLSDANSEPSSALIADSSGNLYGTTNDNHFGGGAFELTPAGNGTWTESFYEMTNGQTPNGLTLDSKTGNLFGTSGRGGSGGCGVVFQLTPPSAGNGSWSETVLYNFSCGDDGATPDSTLIQDAQGRLYGTTLYAGDGLGVVFMLTPPSQSGGSWTEQVLHTFVGGYDSGWPSGTLAMDGHGALYGTTSYRQAGSTSWGTVFKLTPTKSGVWDIAILHRFDGSSDGWDPGSRLVLDSVGAVYGTALGGTGCPSNVHLGCGIVFQLVPPSTGGTWTEDILYEFGSAGSADGLYPSSGIAFDSTGTLYGTTYGGGKNLNGTVFQLTPPTGGVGPWSINSVSLPRDSEGSPGVVLVGNTYYGTTTWGTNDGGTVFELVF